MKFKRKPKYVRKLCERCEKVSFVQLSRQKYCGSYKRKEGCSWIVRHEFNVRYARKWRKKNPERTKKYDHEQHLKKKARGYYKTKEYQAKSHIKYLRKKARKLSTPYRKNEKDN